MTSVSGLWCVWGVRMAPIDSESRWIEDGIGFTLLCYEHQGGREFEGMCPTPLMPKAKQCDLTCALSALMRHCSPQSLWLLPHHERKTCFVLLCWGRNHKAGLTLGPGKASPDPRFIDKVNWLPLPWCVALGTPLSFHLGVYSRCLSSVRDYELCERRQIKGYLVLILRPSEPYSSSINVC